MDIILDTNIFRADIPLKNKDFDVLLDYLERTGSNLVMPQIVLDETKSLYKRTLIERLEAFQKAGDKLNLALTSSIENIVPDLDLDQEVDKYIEFVKKRLKISERKIIPYNNDFLPIISKRAIDRTKPCGDDGQGFRDALIWLTAIEYAKSCHEKQVIFISLNTSDFANSSNELHESLREECEKENTRINYFRTIKDFIVQHSTKTEHITLDWISDHIDLDEVAEHLCDIAGSNSRLISSFERDTGNESTGHLNAFKAHPYDLNDLFIYEMIDNTLIANVTAKMELEVEIEYYVPDYRYEEYPSYDGSTAYNCLEVDVYLAITIENEEVSEWDISEWDFYSNWNRYS
ncbi:PIN domain-containing protein [Marinoscillum luteum]|uniref:PIN domain-containing protein n=1 Tax=Marinoscillum luteum TaxID=861051 RepID=A0ABW7N7U1_9BACT